MTVKCLKEDTLMTADDIVVVLSLRSASAVGNSKLIGYCAENNCVQTVKNSPSLKNNIIKAFGMH